MGNMLYTYSYLLLILCLYRHCICVFLVDKPKNWSYFVFAQQWPPAACLDVPGGACKIPEGVDDWTVHGLWPSSDKGYPSFCNNSWPYNPQSLKSILEALEVKWPNIYAHSSENKFWQHEWSKHGTCSTSLQKYDTELKYFTRSLKLHDRFNIYDFMRRDSINPSKDYPILLKYAENSIRKNVQNKTIKLFCKHHKKYAFPVLTSMYICLDKEERLIDCDKIDEPECDKAHVFYLPFNETNSLRINDDVFESPVYNN